MEQLFGRLPDGRAVRQFTLTGGRISCDVLDYGATLRALRVPDRGGRLRDVVLGFDRMEDYLSQDSHHGATIGRFANRIGGAGFRLDGKDYPLAANDGRNHLHGGVYGFDRQLWTVTDASESGVTFSLLSPDGQEGYPGSLRVTVRYALDEGALTLEYRAETDKPTLCSLTNHAYFNLNGHADGEVLGHTVQIRADCYTPSDAGAIPTGEILPVDGTPMDLRRETPIGAQIDADFSQLQQAGGYDHNWVPNGSGLREVAAARGERSGIRMRVFSTQPGLQFYTGNYLGGDPAGKGGAVYRRRCGFCLETQAFPDAPNKPQFPSAALRPGETYRQTTVYRFDTK